MVRPLHKAGARSHAMKLCHSSLCVRIVLGLASIPGVSGLAAGATQLPYFGPDQRNCNINLPAGPYADLDAGFVPSEDCSHIYVLPPRFGVFEAQPIQFSVISKNACPGIASAIQGFTPPAGSDYQAQLQAAAQLESYKAAIKMALPGVEAYAAASASLDWNGLVRAYKSSNPGRGIQFLAMPIRAGVLSMGSATKHVGTLKEFENELHSVRVSSYQPPAAGGSDSFEPLPTYLAITEDDASSFIMGQSVGLEVRFGILGACRLNDASRAEDGLSGTYTYVYPVQSKGLVRYEFNKDVLVPVIRKYIQDHKESFSTQELSDEIKGKQAFNIVINEGAFPDTGITDRIEEFKKTLGAQATDTMLQLLSRQNAISLSIATTRVTTEHRSRRCSGSLFWKRCHTDVWYSTSEHVDWERFADDLVRNFKAPDVSAQTYKTFYIRSTSAVVAKKNINPQR